MNAPALMTADQTERYTAFLGRLAHTAQGRMRQFFEDAISAISPWSYL